MSAKDSIAQVGAVKGRREVQPDADGLSPQIRRLISSFGGVDPGRRWEPDAFVRRPSTPPRSQGGS
jgi:hypothetical protein